MDSLVIFPQGNLGEDDFIAVKDIDTVKFWSGASGNLAKMSNLFGLEIPIRGPKSNSVSQMDRFKSVEHAMQSTKLEKDAVYFLHGNAPFGSFEFLRKHPDCNALVSILFPKSKHIIAAGGDPFAAKTGIGYWYNKGMDGILAKMLVKEETSMKIVTAAKVGKIDSSFKKFRMDTVKLRGGGVFNTEMRNPETWHRVLSQKFTKNKYLGHVLRNTKGKRLIEFVRGKHAASNHWGGKIIPGKFNGNACWKLVGGNTMGLYIERVRAHMLSCE